jgi:hypothetical protein
MPIHSATPLYALALDFVGTRTQDWPETARVAAIRDREVRTAEEAIFEAGISDEAIKARCNIWVRLINRHAPKEGG